METKLKDHDQLRGRFEKERATMVLAFVVGGIFGFIIGLCSFGLFKLIDKL